MAVVAPPGAPFVFVANVRTGAWTKFTGWTASCLLEFNGRTFFGTPDGNVVEGNTTGRDQGVPYTATYIPLFTDFGVGGVKTSGMARAVFRSPVAVEDKITALADYNAMLTGVPNATFVPVGDNAWGTAVWGAFTWGADGGSRNKSTFSEWRSVQVRGDVLSMGLQVTSGSDVTLDAELVRIDLTYKGGNPVQ
jgi:hypothetical protein